MYFLIHPLVWINDERMAVHCLESGCIGLYIPSDLEISLGPRDVPRASPSGHLSGLGKSLGRRGCTTQYIPPLGSVRIQYKCFPLARKGNFTTFYFSWDCCSTKEKKLNGWPVLSSTAKLPSRLSHNSQCRLSTLLTLDQFARKCIFFFNVFIFKVYFPTNLLRR